MGGLEGFMRGWAEAMVRVATREQAARAADLAGSFRDYATLSPEDRRHLVVRALAALEEYLQVHV